MLSSISNYFCFNEPPSLLLVLPVSLYCFARCVAPKRSLLFCKFYFVGSLYMVAAGCKPPSVSRKKMYITNIFSILQHREPASLKTFPAPLGALKRKRVRLKARGRFSTLYFYKGGLYFDFKRRTA
jgi:hypothetical protein